MLKRILKTWPYKACIASNRTEYLHWLHDYLKKDPELATRVANPCWFDGPHKDERGAMMDVFNIEGDFTTRIF